MRLLEHIDQFVSVRKQRPEDNCSRNKYSTH